MSTLKTCTKCDQTQDTTEFYKDKKKKDGLTSHCKTCQIGRYKNNDEYKKTKDYANKQKYLKEYNEKAI
jgi:hypothetical protein